jgi:type I restriction enzyme S subunit
MREGWEIKKLGEVCDFQGGSQPPKSQFIYEPKDGYVRFLQIRDFASDKNITYIPESRKNRYCKEDDILLGRYGASVGKVLIQKAGAYNVAVMKTIPNEAILFKRYLFFYLNTDDFQTRLINTASRSAQDGFSKDDIFDFPILIPPLPEQQRIVAILDECFAALDKAKANAEQNLKNAKELFESYLQGVFEKKGEGWEVKTIQEITKVINGYAFSSNDFQSTNSIKSVKITNVGVKEFVEESENYLPEKFRETLKEFQVREGDIVIALTRTIISAGLKVAVIPKSYDGALINQRVAAMTPKEKLVNQEFLYFFLCSKAVEKYVLEHVNTLMQPNLSINDLKKMPVYLPSLEDQQTIVRQLDVLRAETQRLESVYQQKLADLEELKKSILQKAFAGELTGKSIAS